MSKLGTENNPLLSKPEDGSPYGGMYCKCSKCGIVAQCTVHFDFYTPAGGGPLKCESCLMGDYFKNEKNTTH